MESPVIELIYDRDCPNVEPCRAILRSALEEVGMAPSWREWARDSPDTPAPYRAFGSPTVLLDGRDISLVPGGAAPAGNSCRIYVDEEGGALRGTPSMRTIVGALASRGSTCTP
jgi:hypothetical protein